MSQSAENQSAIIENENNFNIAMESQAAEPESSHASECLEGIPTADFEPGTPTQDEAEQRPDIDEAVRSDLGDGDVADNNDTGEEITAGAEDADLKGEQMQTHPQEETGQTRPLDGPSESQEASELRSHSPAEGQDRETGAEAMEVDEPELAGNYNEGRENDYNEPEVTDEAQDDKTDQQYLGENDESEPVSSQVEPEYCEAEADNSVIGPNSEVQEDQGIATDDVDMEEREFQPAETVSEDQNPSIKGDRGIVDEDQNPSIKGDRGIVDEDQNPSIKGDSGIVDEDQNPSIKGDSGIVDEDQNPSIKGDRGIVDEDQNPSIKGDSGIVDEDQNPSIKGDSGIVDEDQNPSIKGDSGIVDEDQNREMGGNVASQEDQNQAVEDAERQQVEDQNLPMEDIQPDESGTADEDQNLALDKAEGYQDDIGVPDNDQNLPVEETGQPAENEALQEDQNLPTEETGEWGESEQDQNIAVGDGGQLVKPEQDQNPPMEENTGQLDKSEQNQNLPMEDTEQLDYPQQDQNLPMEDAEHQPEEDQNTAKEDTEQLGEPDQNVATESTGEQNCEIRTPCEDQNVSVEDAEGANNVANDVENQIWEEMDQTQRVDSDRPEDDQQMLETEQDQQPENERAEDDQTLAANETEADQQDEIIDEEKLLAEEPSQDEGKADGDSQNLDSENQRAEEASVCLPDASVTEDTSDIKACVETSDHEAGLQEDISTNEGLDSGKVNETEETGNKTEETGNKLTTLGDAEATEVDQETTTASQLNTTQSDSKSTDGLEKLVEDTEQAMDPEADRASDATIDIVEGRDIDDEPMLQVTDIKSGADAEEKLDEKQESAGDVNSDETCMDSDVKAEKVSDSAGEPELTDSQTSADTTEKTDAEKKPAGDVDDDDDDDVVVLDDEGEASSQEEQKDLKKEVLNSNNDMGIQIESVSGGANDVHGTNEHSDVRQVDAQQKSNQDSTAAAKTSAKGNASPVKKSRTQTCIVCKKIGKCKYNIVRNGDIKHLCDEACFKRFRANPSVFLKGAGGGSSTPAAEKKSSDGKASAGAPAAQGSSKPPVPGYKTCTVCLLMNLNTQGQFCIWKGLDFCGEGCLGKFQSGISSSCALCSSFIPLASRPTHCLRIGNQMRPFCSSRCLADYKLRLRLCTQCQKDAASVPDAFFSAPVGSDGSFKDFCSQTCMKKFEELLNTDVEIIRVEAGKPYSVSKCSVCLKKEVIKHTIKYKGNIHNLCGDACVSAFQYANKLDMKTCEFCSALCTSRESSLHTVQFEGHQKQFCSDDCVTKFRFNNRKVSPCSWCGTQRDNFDMIERLDSASKYQLFCSLNCLSLYRVNLQAKSNQPVCCDQCTKRSPAQYHLTMSDASVRNFCSYNCVMTFQAQFSKGPPPSHPPSSTPSTTPATQPPPPQKSSSRGRPRRAGRQQSPAASPSFPIISNVISLAPQGGQQVNIKNSTGMPVVVSGAAQGIKTSGTAAQGPVQQQIIIQPPPPKPVKNKSIMCKPFAQTKATSCRPHTQSKDCQTDEVQQKPVMVPVPVPVYMPAPMSLYSAPAPTPIFVPIPIPVPIFIPTTRKSANGILKQIKEIREKTPSDPLEAELLMMAAAVSADGKNSSDSESEEEILPEVSRPRKRLLQADDDDDADVMPLTSNAKEEEGGEEDMISMALRMAEEMSGPITDLESAVEAVPVNTEPPPQPPRPITPDAIVQDEEMIRNRRGGKRGGATARRGGTGRPAKRPRLQVPQPEAVPIRQEPPPPPPPPADANYHLKFTYGVNAWRHWVLFKNNQIERNIKPGCGRVKLFKTDIMQCTADELNFSLCLFVKEVRKPNGEEYSADSIYYLCLGIQQYLFENGRIDNIFTDFYYERFTECLTQILSKCQPKFNASGQMVCRIEEEHLWECKQLGAHSPYVLLNTLIYFHTKYFMLKTPEDHMKLSFAHILKYWKKGQPGKGGQPARSVSLRYYSVSTAKKDGSAPTSATKKGSKDGIPVYEVTENQENPLRCPVKLYEFYLSKCPESIKNRSDIFYPVPERSCVPDSPVWYSTMPISTDVMTKMLTRILLVREIQEAHLHAQPIYV